jgi:hypothetical protein
MIGGLFFSESVLDGRCSNAGTGSKYWHTEFLPLVSRIWGNRFITFLESFLLGI